MNMNNQNKEDDSLDYWCNLILNCAKRSYNAIHEITGTKEAYSPVNTEHRGAGGDVTLGIDKIAEDAIIEELKKTKLPFKLITEETGEVIYKEEEYFKIKCEDKIIVDPVDGSHNAAVGFPMSCISLAHSAGPNLSDIDVGVIVNIYSGDIYCAVKGKGAKLNEKTIHVSEKSNLRHSLFGISLSLGEPLNEFVDRYKFLFQQPLKIRSFGTNALGYALVAKGALMCFMDLQKKCRTFDIAAGYIILKEAGGTIWDLEGNDLDSVLDLTSRIAFICLNKGLVSQFEKFMPDIIEAFKTQPKFKNE